MNTIYKQATLALATSAFFLSLGTAQAQYGQLPPHLDINNLKRATPVVSKGAPANPKPTTVVGSGPNYATFVVDFNDGLTTQSYTWGYRWSGTDSAEDILNLVNVQDPRFFTFQGAQGSFGVPLFGLAYDADGDLDPDVSFFPFGPNGRQPAPSTGSGSFQVDGPWSDVNADLNSPNDPDDNYQSGWLSDGFWSFYTSTDGANWTSSFVSLGAYTLRDGDYIALSYWPAFTEVLPASWVPATISTLPTIAFNGGTTVPLQLNNSIILEIGFNEAVQGVDVSDLVVSGSASKSAAKTTSVDSVTMINPTTAQFVISDVQTGTLNYSLAPDAGDIQDLQGNNLAPQSGSLAVVTPSNVHEWAIYD